MKLINCDMNLSEVNNSTFPLFQINDYQLTTQTHNFFITQNTSGLFQLFFPQITKSGRFNNMKA